mmetsp:Transcript_7158/g.14315  ORF Transcript_7158/g.14315 Transcript_7158/m.14315 type:complete len:118 (+) Transcript_7158:1165-1518(+)
MLVYCCIVQETPHLLKIYVFVVFYLLVKGFHEILGIKPQTAGKNSGMCLLHGASVCIYNNNKKSQTSMYYMTCNGRYEFISIQTMIEGEYVIESTTVFFPVLTPRRVPPSVKSMAPL